MHIPDIPENRVYRADNRGIPDVTGEAVAVNARVLGGWGVSDDMREARLMAASWELREALQKLLTAVQQIHGNFPFLSEVEEETRALLARIEKGD